MATSEEQITKLFRIRKTLMEMLRDRGYFVTDFEINMTRTEFVDKFGMGLNREDLMFNKTKRNDSSNQIFVFFPKEKIGKIFLEGFAKRLRSEKISRAIFVVQNSISYASRQYTISLQGLGLHMEIFQETELLFSVGQHVLVLEHQVLSDEEKKTLLERYTLQETQLPRIQLADPSARYYGLKLGQVVKIIRPSETAGRYVTYRICV